MSASSGRIASMIGASSAGLALLRCCTLCTGDHASCAVCSPAYRRAREGSESSSAQRCAPSRTCRDCCPRSSRGRGNWDACMRVYRSGEGQRVLRARVRSSPPTQRHGQESSPHRAGLAQAFRNPWRSYCQSKASDAPTYRHAPTSVPGASPGRCFGWLLKDHRGETSERNAFGTNPGCARAFRSRSLNTSCKDGS